VCWAHLKRDFQKLVARGGESAQFGQDLLDVVERWFRVWQRVREGTSSRAEFPLEPQPIWEGVHTLLSAGVNQAHPKTRRRCKNLLKLEPALWTFVFVDGVEPTNNRAERCLWRAVLWRRRSFGTPSKAGSRFVGRVLTTVTTLRQPKRDVLDYLTDACIAALRGETPPSLLKESQTT
jgi:transposase